MAICRSWVKLLMLIGLAWQLPANGWAQAYPAKPVRYVVTDQAGSGTDVLARVVARELTETLGQQVVVDNRPGAASTIGAELVSRAPADGYTLVQLPTTVTVTATLYKNLPYNLVRDFTPVTRVASGPSVAVVPPSSPLKSIGDLLKLAKAKPGTINSASAGVGTCTFLAGELFKKKAGVDLMHVPYRGGGDALTAILSGEAAVYFAPLAVALPQIRAGKLRALAVTSAQRLPFLPEFPTVAESGVPGFEFSCWYALFVPSATPKQTVGKIHSALMTVLKKPDVIKRFNALGYVPGDDQPDRFAAFVKSEIANYREIVRGIPAQ